MIKMLIIADDLTGALDTGVKLAACGARTRVVTEVQPQQFDAADVDVLTLCVPTRHLAPQEAYRRIYDITREAVRAGVECIFKKTDSALRGNVGAELGAVLDGSGESTLCFIPALPGMNRVTRGGVQYIDGVPVHESVFGHDPFEPVTESSVPALIRRQCSHPVRVVAREEEAAVDGAEPCIYVFDAESCEDMERRAAELQAKGKLHLLAGCAGLAQILPAYLGFSRRTENFHGDCERLTVVCGSVNPISREQMDCAEACGGRRLHIPLEQLLAQDSLREGRGREMMDDLWTQYRQSSCLLIDTAARAGGDWGVEETGGMTLETMRQRISTRLGRMLRELIVRGAGGCFMIIGGDTLQAFLEALQCRELTPIGEPEPGVVLSEVACQGRVVQILSKSGGFGETELLVSLERKLVSAVSPAAV